MTYTAKETYKECIKQFFGIDGRESLGGISNTAAAGSAGVTQPGNLAGKIFAFIETLAGGQADLNLLPSADGLAPFFNMAESQFTDKYGPLENTDFFKTRAEIIFGSSDPLKKARAVSELWSPELTLDDELIYNSWKLSGVTENARPYKPEEVLIQLNALYTVAGPETPGHIDDDTASEYRAYMQSGPEKIAVYDHPVPVFTRGKDHELEKCLVELNDDIAFEKECGAYPPGHRLKVLISVSTTHKNLDAICEKWLTRLISELSLTELECYLLTERMSRQLGNIFGGSADIFTVQGKYACHFGALKYAQLIFEKACGIRAGFKLDTDEGIHSRDMKAATGKTWFEQLCHPYWGGTAVKADGRNIALGFNVGEYVDSRDLDKLGYPEALRTPEVKPKDDLRGPFLLFNKGACQAKGTMLYNRAKGLEDFISHPLVKGGGYGVDNQTLRAALPVGFSMVGRAEDQQFYFSAINEGFQGIFNPLLRIIHYKEAVAGSETKAETGRNIADIYRLLLFRHLMTYLNVVEQTRPFPSNYASELAEAQAFFLWLHLTCKASAEGDEAAAEEYLEEGLKELIPLLREIESGEVIMKYEKERQAWKEFTLAVDELSREEAAGWVAGLKS